jgi:hypothetical protein
MTRAAEFASAGNRTFKNVIIGGDFTVNPWQRGTSFVAPSNIYTADRWRSSTSQANCFDITKEADAPTVAQAGVYTQHCLMLNVQNTVTPTAGQVFGCFQIVEGLNAARFGFGQSGTRYITLSFWHKHTATGTYGGSIRNSAADRSYVFEYTQAVTDTWEKAEVTIPVDTSGTWLYTNGIGLTLYFTIASGSTYETTAGAWTAGNYLTSGNQTDATTSATNNCRFALVQLEAGPEATEFEARDVGTELALCQRYYCKSYTQGTNPGTATAVGQREIYLTGFNAAAHFVRFDQPFPTTMRTTPSVSAYSPQTGTVNKVYDLASAGDVNASVTHISDVSFCGGGTTASSSTANINYHWIADAEI